MQRLQQIVVDSKWRRTSQCPNNWQYIISFPESLHNVTSLDLVQAFIPNTQQTVHTFNSNFQCTLEGQDTITVSIPTGNYEPPLLLTAIQDRLTAAGVPNPQLILSSDTNIVTMTCDEPFSLPFATGDEAENSIHPYLGFSNIDISNVTTASGVYAMSLPPPRYVTVAVDEIPLLGKKKGYTLQYEVPRVFNTRPELLKVPFNGLVPLNTDFQTYKFWKASSVDVLQKTFQPIHIRQFSITIRDDRGNFYDANGYNHVLIFQISQLNNPELPLMCPGNNRFPGPSAWGVNCRVPYC